MIPQLQEIFIDQPTEIKVVYTKVLKRIIDHNPNRPLIIPVPSFTINYGEIPIDSVEIPVKNPNTVVLTVPESHQFAPAQIVTLTYTVPPNANMAVQSQSTSTSLQLAKAFSQVPVKNRLNIDETTWENNSNLASGGYPRDDRSDPATATPADFILAFGQRETIQLTNLEDPKATTVNLAKLNMAIQDATALIDNYVIQASRAGKFLISSNRRRTALTIARYYLDSVRKRKDIVEDYERCIKELDKARDTQTAIRPHDPWWLTDDDDGKSGVRAHKVSQVYNRRTGKGLEGFWIDDDEYREPHGLQSNY